MIRAKIAALMLAVIRGVRSLVSVLLIGLLFALGSPVLRLGFIPAIWMFPGRRHRMASLFIKGMSYAITALLTVGGARFRRHGTLPTHSPILVIANHQALLDICQAAIMAWPGLPAFVTRRRYARFVPLVSAAVRLHGSPIVDPRRDPAGAIEAMRRGARELPYGLLIFAEGHRSRDGEIRPFRTAGLEAVLAERRLPVYLLLNDGVWQVRRFVDLLFRVHLIDAYSEAMGPFDPPTEPADIPAFITGLRAKLVARLAEHRAGIPPAA